MKEYFPPFILIYETYFKLYGYLFILLILSNLLRILWKVKK